MRHHPSERELALLAGGDSGFLSRFLLSRHVRGCRECAETAARFQAMRTDLKDSALPEVDWNRLELEMRANIRLGLEAGECVRLVPASAGRNPRLAVALASLIALAAAGVLLRNPAAHPAIVKAAGPVLESSGQGLELRNGASSMTLMNRNGSVADQTVSAQGEIRARYVDGGSVTINNVYLE